MSTATLRKVKREVRKSSPMQSAWEVTMGTARGVYRMEIDRLTGELRTRILAGEFSGHEDEGRGGPAYCKLAWELERTHPWARQEGEEVSQSLLVIAVSTWPARQDRLLAAGGLSGEGPTSGECLAHDIMEEAARRGWIKPLRTLRGAEPYTLRVA